MAAMLILYGCAESLDGNPLDYVVGQVSLRGIWSGYPEARVHQCGGLFPKPTPVWKIDPACHAAGRSLVPVSAPGRSRRLGFLERVLLRDLIGSGGADSASARAATYFAVPRHRL